MGLSPSLGSLLEIISVGFLVCITSSLLVGGALPYTALHSPGIQFFHLSQAALAIS